jgi:hypothetical protein
VPLTAEELEEFDPDDDWLEENEARRLAEQGGNAAPRLAQRGGSVDKPGPQVPAIRDLFEPLYQDVRTEMQYYSETGDFAAWVKEKKRRGENIRKAAKIPEDNKLIPDLLKCRSDQRWQGAFYVWAKEKKLSTKAAFLDAAEKFRKEPSWELAEAIVQKCFRDDLARSYSDQSDKIRKRVKGRQERDSDTAKS